MPGIAPVVGISVGKGERNGGVHIDAHKLCGSFVLGYGLHGVAHFRLVDKQRERHHDDCGCNNGDQCLARDDELPAEETERFDGHDRREGFRRRAPDEQRQVLQQIAHADGRNEHGEAGRLPQRLIGHAFDGNAQQRANHHRRADCRQRGQAQRRHHYKSNVAAHHDDVAMREIQHTGNAVHHRIAQGNDRINTAQADAVHKVR